MKKSGFFDEEEEIIRGDETLSVSKPRLINASCKDCGLEHKCKSPHMKPTGKGRLKILIVGEAPGAKEDEKGTQFVGQSGQLLRKAMRQIGLDLDRDFWKTNALCCRPPENAKPDALQIAACRKNLMKTIERLEPKAVITMGKSAMDSLVGYRMTGRLRGLSMTDWVGCAIPDQTLKLFICPTWHPSYALRTNKKTGEEETDNVVYEQMRDHLTKASAYSDVPFYSYDYDAECVTIDSVDEAIKIVRDFHSRTSMALDYETTGKKPQRDGHRIVTASISDGLLSYAFPFFNDRKFRREWRALLVDPHVGKIAHNCKFENVWSRVRSGLDDTEGVWIENIVWDTIIGAHSLNNRKKTNLKFQSYVNFGIAGYDDKVDAYLECTPKENALYGANGFNRIDDAPLDDLLHYNALDSYLEYKLYEKQKADCSQFLKKGVRLFTKGNIAFSRAENNGIVFDTESAKVFQEGISRKMDRIESDIRKMPVLKKWDRPNAFRVSATGDITHLLFDILNNKCSDENRTKTGKPCSDVDSLEKHKKTPIVSEVLKWRKWEKVRNTYLKGFSRESVNNIIYAMFNLERVDTYRSSSDSPNFQNIPKRDLEIAKLLRSLFHPRPGHKLGEYDYKAIEVCIYACYTLDPNLIAYINDQSTDMHRDEAAELFIRDPNAVTSKERYGAKNGFVFPTFYGSWYKNTANNLWTAAEPETIAHLKEEGIKNIRDFTEHVRGVEEDFWENRFPVAHEWMEKTISEYNKKGYIDLYTGFRCRGPMGRNELFNYRIQGTAFHCLLYTYEHVQERLEREKMNTLLLGQIHDAIIPDIDPNEEKEVDRMIWNYGTQQIREDWDWLVVPLNIDKSVSDVDGAWSKMNGCGLLKGRMK